jgi:hypothetical protein
MRLYLGNKMSGVPYFNAPWFTAATSVLRDLGWGVFNPAEQDIKRGFDPMKCPHGTLEEARIAGFVLRDALGEDYAWITKHSDGLVVGPQWHDSPGTISEIAVHQALRLPVWEYETFISKGYLAPRFPKIQARL